MGFGDDDPNKPEEKGQLTTVDVVKMEAPKLLLVPKVEVELNKVAPLEVELELKPKVGDGTENGEDVVAIDKDVTPNAVAAVVAIDERVTPNEGSDRVLVAVFIVVGDDNPK